MEPQQLGINRIPKRTLYPTIIHKQGTEICKEHVTNLIEMWQGNIKIGEYCPVCYRQQMREGNG